VEIATDLQRFSAEPTSDLRGESGVPVASVGADRVWRNCLRCGLPEELVSNGGDA